MYFLPRNNKFYSWAAHIKPTYRYLLTGTVTIFLFLSWWFFIYIPFESVIHTYQKQITAMHTQYKNIKKAQKSCTGLEQSIKNLQSTVQSYCVDCDNSQQDQLTQLLHHIEKSGLHLQEYNVVATQDKDWYLCDNAHCVFEGSLSQFMNFLQELQQSKQLIACENISLNRTSDDNLFNISCDMQFFTVKKA